MSRFLPFLSQNRSADKRDGCILFVYLLGGVNPLQFVEGHAYVPAKWLGIQEKLPSLQRRFVLLNLFGHPPVDTRNGPQHVLMNAEGSEVQDFAPQLRQWNSVNRVCPHLPKVHFEAKKRGEEEEEAHFLPTKPKTISFTSKFHGFRSHHR